jgi:mono/diheme cytochrome c family protein
MVRQMKVRAQAPLGFFADNRGSRVPVSGTVPIGYEMPKADQAADTDPSGQTAMHPQLGFSNGVDYYNTGKMGTNWGTGMPMEVTPALLQRGQQRFNINCAVCHGATADGNGIAKQYGLTTVQSLQQDRIRTMADGEIFNTITNGKNTMMSYGPNVTVPDRWAIIAYLRALQRSQNATAADVPPEHRVELDKPEGAPAAGANPPAGAAPSPAAKPEATKS